ncbi:hypothetical protein HKD37_01G000291 [Glycine soja]|nr:hypothetical protein GmHk_01G000313 [Glycine max]
MATHPYHYTDPLNTIKMSYSFTLRSSSVAASNWCTFMCANQVQDLTFYIYKIKKPWIGSINQTVSSLHDLTGSPPVLRF